MIYRRFTSATVVAAPSSQNQPSCCATRFSQSLTNRARTLLGSSWSSWCISEGLSINWLWSWNSTWKWKRGIKQSLKPASCLELLGARNLWRALGLRKNKSAKCLTESQMGYEQKHRFYQQLCVLPEKPWPSTVDVFTDATAASEFQMKRSRGHSESSTTGKMTEKWHGLIWAALFLTWYRLWVCCLMKEALRVWPFGMLTVITSSVSGGPERRQSWLWRWRERGVVGKERKFSFSLIKPWKNNLLLAFNLWIKAFLFPDWGTFTQVKSC